MYGAGVVEWQEAALPMSCNIERATEPRRLPKDVVAALGAVILSFHGVSYPYE